MSNAHRIRTVPTREPSCRRSICPPARRSTIRWMELMAEPRRRIRITSPNMALTSPISTVTPSTRFACWRPTTVMIAPATSGARPAWRWATSCRRILNLSLFSTCGIVHARVIRRVHRETYSARKRCKIAATCARVALPFGASWVSLMPLMRPSAFAH